MKFTEKAIQSRLRFYFNDHCCIPNIALKMGFESDLIAITRAGYYYECEIKLSKNDFYADFRKANIRYGQYEGKTMKKHDLLANEVYGPRKFYFACPENLLHVDQIPAHAGLLFVTDGGNIREAKPAPVLKGVKLDQNLYWRALNGLGWRFWEARSSVDQQQTVRTI